MALERRDLKGAYLDKAGVGGIGVALDPNAEVGRKIDWAADGLTRVCSAIGCRCKLEVLDDDLSGGGGRGGKDSDDAKGLHGEQFFRSQDEEAAVDGYVDANDNLFSRNLNVLYIPTNYAFFCDTTWSSLRIPWKLSYFGHRKEYPTRPGLTSDSLSTIRTTLRTERMSYHAYVHASSNSAEGRFRKSTGIRDQIRNYRLDMAI